MYGLAAHEEQDENSDRWLGIAAGITNTCHESYDRTDTKLGPEAFRFTDAVEARAVKQNERYYILRYDPFVPVLCLSKPLDALDIPHAI